MSNFRKLFSNFVISLCVLACLAVSPDNDTLAAEQDVSSETGESVVADLQQEEITSEFIQSEIEQIKNAQLTKDLHESVINFYNKALEHIQSYTKWVKSSAEFEKLIQQAPERLKLLKSALSKPVEEQEPNVPADATLEQLQGLLAQAELKLQEIQNEIARLNEETKQRAERRVKLPELLTTAKGKLASVNEQISSQDLSQEPAELQRAKKISLLAEKKSVENEITSYEKELTSYDTRGELLTAEQDNATREKAQAEKLLKAWQQLVNDKRRKETESAAADAQKAKQQAGWEHPVVKKAAEKNAEFAKQRTQKNLAGRIEKATSRYASVKKELDKLVEEYSNLTSKLKAVGLTAAMNLRLRKKLEELPDITQYEKSIAARKEELGNIQLALLELEEKRQDNISAASESLLSQVSVSAPERESMKSSLLKLLGKRRELVDSLKSDYDTLFVKLVDLDNKERQLIKKTEEIDQYINERILWTRSTHPVSAKDIVQLKEPVEWFTRPGNWKQTGSFLWQRFEAQPFIPVLAIAVFLILGLLRPRCRNKLHHIGREVSEGNTVSFTPTLYAAFLTVLLAIFWPGVIWSGSKIFFTGFRAPTFARTLGFAMSAVSVVWLFGSTVRQMCCSNGLCISHFGKSAKAMKFFRKNISSLMILGLGLVFIIALTEKAGKSEWSSSLGRFGFIAGQVLLCIFAKRIFHPKGKFFELSQKDRGGKSPKSNYLWYIIGIVVPLTLAILAGIGYYYSAVRLTIHLQMSLWLILVVLSIYEMAFRWLLISRRQLALKQAEQQREKEDETETIQEQQEQEPEADIYALSEQVRKLLRTLLGFSLVLGLWLIWIDVLPALRILDQIELWTTSTSPSKTLMSITLGRVVLAVIILIITFAAARNIPGMLKIFILQRLPLQAGVDYAITTVCKYIIILTGIVISFQSIGIGWAKVQWLAAAVTVGLGFGLQEIFANFVSGLIILFERPIRIGDMVAVGDINAFVTKIQIRATTVIDWDNRELLIPNKEFITSRVINWTLSSPVTRLVIPVGIAYGSDTKLAHDLLYKVAKSSPYVLGEPKPSPIFRKFGDSSLEFELRVFLPRRKVWPEAIDDLHMRIDQAFRKAGIEIAFPQRDVHVRSIKDILPIIKKQNHESSTDENEK